MPGMANLSSGEISAAVTDLGWRYVLNVASTSVPAGSLAEAAELAGRVVAAAGADAGSVRLDVRADRLVVEVAAGAVGAVRRISAALGAPGAGAPPVQKLEIAVDALDIPAVLPFWQAILDYVPEPGYTSSLMDPRGQGPVVWFQQMDAPRPQRNRIHFDISVPHDEADARIKATLAAGGTLVSDEEAPAFWIMADAEGNEVCICTWQGRD
jgi:4a-hydroxytetrahydrobiopterin dehydratase